VRRFSDLVRSSYFGARRFAEVNGVMSGFSDLVRSSYFGARPRVAAPGSPNGVSVTSFGLRTLEPRDRCPGWRWQSRRFSDLVRSSYFGAQPFGLLDLPVRCFSDLVRSSYVGASKIASARLSMSAVSVTSFGLRTLEPRRRSSPSARPPRFQ